MDGHGVFTWNNGYRYEGSFCDGKKSGMGCLFDPEGTVKYVGEWQNDKKNGQGTSFFANKKVSYTGIFT